MHAMILTAEYSISEMRLDDWGLRIGHVDYKAIAAHEAVHEQAVTLGHEVLRVLGVRDYAHRNGRNQLTILLGFGIHVKNGEEIRIKRAGTERNRNIIGTPQPLLLQM